MDKNNKIIYYLPVRRTIINEKVKSYTKIYNNIRDKYLIELDNLKNFLKEKVK